jgi:MOSC domain-containing protein YiiM
VTGAQLRLVSVNVARPAVIGTHRGLPVWSAIAKRPVEAEWLRLDAVNLEGDGQADREAHGGPDKAVYAYPSEHLPAWSEELGEELGPAAFGENLTTAGATEADVRIGDRWAWGDALLEVCQPRWPCFKLTIHRGRADIGPRLRRSGRTGWYLRVLEPGRVPVAGPIEVVERHPAAVTVLDAHLARSPGHRPDPERLVELVRLKPLALEWRYHLADLLTA